MEQRKKVPSKIIAIVLLMLLALPIMAPHLPFQQSALAETGSVYRVTASSGLRIRSGAGTSYNVLGTLKSGAKVKHVNSKSGWWLIETQAGKQGYVDPKYLAKSDSTDSGTTPSSGKLYYINASGRVNVRASASTSSRVKGRLRGGTVVRLLGTSGDWGYVEVYNNGNRGYIQKNYLLKY